MNVLVVYASLTGNTQKLAAAMAEELDVSPRRKATFSFWVVAFIGIDRREP